MTSEATNGRERRKPTIVAHAVTQPKEYAWSRGEHCNFHPAAMDLAGSDAVERHVLAGWKPPQPSIGPGTRIMAFGSCFAQNVTKWLAERNFNVMTADEGDHTGAYLIRFGDGMVNTFVIRQQFEWALEGKVFTEELWHGYDAQAFGYDETVRARTRDAILQADVFIITLGLSEVWYDEQTGGVFWRAVPQEAFDPSRHKFRVSSVEENRDNIAATIRLIQQARPGAKIILSLSPIPFKATFRPVSCVTANAVSKAILRAAIDDVMREPGLRDVFYWPSYEIVTTVFTAPWKEDRRHVRMRVLDFIMTLFETVWCHGTVPRMTIAEAWVRACADAGMLPRGVPGFVENQNVERLTAFAEKEQARDGTGLAIVMDRVKEIAAQDPAGRLARWLGSLPAVSGTAGSRSAAE